MRQRPFLASDHPPCARALRNTNQSIPQNGGYAIVWSGVEYDISDPPMWSSGAATRLTAPHPGIYTVNATAGFATQLGGFRLFYIVLNGALKSIGSEAIAGGGWWTGMSVSAESYMAAGDYAELYVYHNHTAALNIDVTVTCAMSLRMVQPTHFTEWVGS